LSEYTRPEQKLAAAGSSCILGRSSIHSMPTSPPRTAWNCEGSRWM